MSDGGKGDKPRPLAVSKDEFDNRWETIFGKNKKSEQVLDMPGTIGSAKLIFKEDDKDNSKSGE